MNIIQAILVLFCASTAIALNAATITAIKKEKSLIKIDQGAGGGFKKGAKVCFFSDKGKKIGCSVIGKATPEFALIKIKSTKLLDALKKGMTANLAESAKAIGGEITEAKSADYRDNMKLAYIFTAVTPTKFNKLTYKAPTTATASNLETLWEKQSVTSRSLLAVIAEGEFGIGESMAMSVGLRYRMFGAYEAISDYNTDATLIDNYVTIAQESSAIGMYTDFTYLNLGLTDSIFWTLGNGLDIDMPSVKFTATKKNDTTGVTTELASYQSSMTLISLRMGTSVKFMIGSFGLIIPAINIVVPVAAVGAKESATVSDTQASMLKSGLTGDEDLKQSISHSKNSFAAEIVLGGMLAF